MEREIKTERYRKAKEDRVLERDKLKDEPKIKLLKKPEKGNEKQLDKREKLKKSDKENLSGERASGQSCTLRKRSEGEFKDGKPERPDDEVAENTGRKSGITNETKSASCRRERG